MVHVSNYFVKGQCVSSLQTQNLVYTLQQSVQEASDKIKKKKKVPFCQLINGVISLFITITSNSKTKESMISFQESQRNYSYKHMHATDDGIEKSLGTSHKADNF